LALDARERLIVAFDLPSVKAAESMVSRLGESVLFYKIGYQLAFAGGLPFAAGLIAAGKQVFLDLKLHDIGNTVARGVESIATLGAAFLTVHAYPQTMKAAVEAAAGSGLKILAVTGLTSYADGDLHAAGNRLNGSDGDDTFVYAAVADSTSKNYDTVKGFGTSFSTLLEPPGRREIGQALRDLYDAEIYHEHPDLAEVLQTEFTAITVGFVASSPVASPTAFFVVDFT